MRVTVKQLAAIFGVDPRTITNWVNSKPPCPSWKEDGRRYFDLIEVADWRERPIRERIPQSQPR